MTKQEVELFLKMSKDFRTFLHHVKFEADYEGALALNDPEKEKVLYEHEGSADGLYAWIAWNLYFGHNVSVLWVMRRADQASPIEKVLSFIHKIGDPTIQIEHDHQSRSLRINSLNRLDIEILSPQVGCGRSLTHLVIEGCVHKGEGWLQVAKNLIPVLKDGPLITLVS